jgi:hypothetical protein
MSSSTFSTAASSPGRPHSVHHVYFQPTNPDDVMVIEVNFGKGRKDDIFVAVGDDPLFLAQVSEWLPSVPNKDILRYFKSYNLLSCYLYIYLTLLGLRRKA